MVPRGLEPRTFRLLAERSNQLSYETHDMLGRPSAIQQKRALNIAESPVGALDSSGGLLSCLRMCVCGGAIVYKVKIGKKNLLFASMVQKNNCKWKT